MTYYIEEWDHTPNNIDPIIIDVYPSNLLDIPINEYEFAECAYYDALGSLLADSTGE